MSKANYIANEETKRMTNIKNKFCVLFTHFNIVFIERDVVSIVIAIASHMRPDLFHNLSLSAIYAQRIKYINFEVKGFKTKTAFDVKLKF